MFATKIKAAVATGAAIGGLLLGTWALGQAGGGGRAHPGTKHAANDRGSNHPKEQALAQVLDKPLRLDFNAAPLESVLKQIKAQTQGGAVPSGVPIYVDPAGLEEAGATMQSKVSITTKDAPLRTSLDELLRPLKLAATTRDGLLIISSRPEIALIEIRKLAQRLSAPREPAAENGPTTDSTELSAAAWLKQLRGGRTEYYSNLPSAEARPEDEARNKAILEALEKPVAMQFANETPLEEVLQYVKESTKGPALANGIPVYVDPVGLQEAEKTMQSPVQLDLTGVALRETLRMLLEQIGLAYVVKNGYLTITCATSGDAETASPMLTLAAKADRGELSLDEMQHLVELFRARDEVARYVASDGSGFREEPAASPAPAGAPPTPSPPPRAEAADEDKTSKAIHAALEKTVALHINGESAADAIKKIAAMTTSPELPEGIPIYMTPGAQAQTVVMIDLKRVKLKVGLRLLLSQAGMVYAVHDGILVAAPFNSPELYPQGSPMGGMGGGMGGMGGGFR